MVYLYGLSNISCEQNRQLQAVMVYETSISASTVEFEAIMQTQDMTAPGMTCCPFPLRNTLKHSKLIWYTQLHFCGIF